VAESRALYQQPIFQPPRKKLGGGAIVAIVIGALALILVLCGVIGVLVWQFALPGGGIPLGQPQSQIKAGDCLTDYKWSGEDARIVDCADADARWNIVEVLPNQTFADGKKTCDAILANTFIFYDGPGPWSESEKGTVVCLTQKRAS